MGDKGLVTNSNESSHSWLLFSKRLVLCIEFFFFFCVFASRQTWHLFFRNSIVLMNNRVRGKLYKDGFNKVKHRTANSGLRHKVSLELNKLNILRVTEKEVEGPNK